LWLLEFTRDEHRYRAELRSEPGASSHAHERGFWFVSIDGNPAHPAFEADVRDEDTEEFRRRIVSAAQGERVGLVENRKAEGAIGSEKGGKTADPHRPGT
jgi:hypothetical protein